MTIIRDLVARITFVTNTTDLERLNSKMVLVKRSIAGIATTALAGWAVKTGGDLAFLQRQLDVGFGDQLDKVKAKINELAQTDPITGLESVFSREALTQAAVIFDRLGISGEDAILRIEQASTLLTRAGTTNIAEVAQSLGTALQKGGIAELFREFRLIDIKTAEELRILESDIASTSGVLHERATREYRKRIAEILVLNREVLVSERDALTISTTGTNMRVGSQMKNLWQEISRIITEFMEPALNAVSKLVVLIETNIKKVRVAMEEAGGASEAFFKKVKALWPDYTDDIDNAQAAWKGLTDFIGGLFDTNMGATLTIGGIAMFLLTKNFAWLAGGLGSASILSIFKKDWNELEGFLATPAMSKIAGGTVGALLMAVLTRNPLWILGGAAVGSKIGGSIGEFTEGDPRKEDVGFVPDPRRGFFGPTSDFYKSIFGDPFQPRGTEGRLSGTVLEKTEDELDEVKRQFEIDLQAHLQNKAARERQNREFSEYLKNFRGSFFGGVFEDKTKTPTEIPELPRPGDELQKPLAEKEVTRDAKREEPLPDLPEVTRLEDEGRREVVTQEVTVRTGDINIMVQGAGINAMEVARLVRKEFSDQVLRVAMEFGPSHEGDFA